MVAPVTRFQSEIQPDEPLTFSARFIMDETDRRYIDNQIRALQTYLYRYQARGVVATYVRISTSLDGGVQAGDVVCRVTNDLNAIEPSFTVANATNLALVGVPFGVVLAAAAPGTLCPVAIGGVLPKQITAINDGLTGFARVSSAGRCERVTTPVVGDVLLGRVDESDFLVMNQGLPSGSGIYNPDTLPTPNTLALRGFPDAYLKATRFEAGIDADIAADGTIRLPSSATMAVKGASDTIDMIGHDGDMGIVIGEVSTDANPGVDEVRIAMRSLGNFVGVYGPNTLFTWNRASLTLGKDATALLTQTTSTDAGVGGAFTIQAQAGFGGGNIGGALKLNPGVGGNNLTLPGDVTSELGAVDNSVATTSAFRLMRQGTDFFSVRRAASSVDARSEYEFTIGTNAGAKYLVLWDEIRFTTNVTAPEIYQEQRDLVTGEVMTVRAQSVVTGTGGNLVLASGDGATAAGNVVIKRGSSTRATFGNGQTTLEDPVVQVKGQIELPPETLSITANDVTIDFNTGNTQTLLLTQDVTNLIFTNLKAGRSVLYVTQDATGSRVITNWPVQCRFVGATPPTLSTHHDFTDIIYIDCDGTSAFITAVIGFDV